MLIIIHGKHGLLEQNLQLFKMFLRISLSPQMWWLYPVVVAFQMRLTDVDFLARSITKLRKAWYCCPYLMALDIRRTIIKIKITTKNKILLDHNSLFWVLIHLTASINKSYISGNRPTSPICNIQTLSRIWLSTLLENMSLTGKMSAHNPPSATDMVTWVYQLRTTFFSTKLLPWNWVVCNRGWPALWWSNTTFSRMKVSLAAKLSCL